MRFRNILIGSAVLASAALLAPATQAQSTQPETTVTGTVVRVYRPGRPACLRGNCGTRLRVQSGNEYVHVRVAPRGFLHRHQFGFHRGDQVTIAGWAGSGNGVFVARRITRGHRSLVLRGPHGRPRWHRGPR